MLPPRARPAQACPGPCAHRGPECGVGPARLARGKASTRPGARLVQRLRLPATHAGHRLDAGIRGLSFTEVASRLCVYEPSVLGPRRRWAWWTAHSHGAAVPPRGAQAHGLISPFSAPRGARSCPEPPEHSPELPEWARTQTAWCFPGGLAPTDLPLRAWHPARGPGCLGQAQWMTPGTGRHPGPPSSRPVPRGKRQQEDPGQPRQSDRPGLAQLFFRCRARRLPAAARESCLFGAPWLPPSSGDAWVWETRAAGAADPPARREKAPGPLPRTNGRAAAPSAQPTPPQTAGRRRSRPSRDPGQRAGGRRSSRPDTEPQPPRRSRRSRWSRRRPPVGAPGAATLREGTRLKGTRERGLGPTKCPRPRACGSSGTPGVTSRVTPQRGRGGGTWKLDSQYLLVMPASVRKLAGTGGLSKTDPVTKPGCGSHGQGPRSGDKVAKQRRELKEGRTLRLIMLLVL